MGTRDQGGGPQASFKDRIDPDGESQRLVAAMAVLAIEPARALMRGLAVSEETLGAARTASGRYAQLLDGLQEVATTLAPLGWIAFGAMPSDTYRQAAQLARDGRTEAAEELLADAWDERLEHAIGPLLHLYEDPDRQPVGRERMNLIREAIDGYRHTRYASAIMLTLSQIDGIVHDMTGADAKSFFVSGGKAKHLTDQHTLPGHPDGLAVLGALFSRDRRHTSLDGDLRRHAIMHGRELGYGTRLNAVKTFVALFAVVEWAKPIAAEETRRLAAEREKRYAGSQESDEWGRRLDRRGFHEVQRGLQTIELYQHARYARAGYTADPRDLELHDELSSIPGIQITVARDGRSYQAWAPTEGGLVFAVAGREGAQIGWRYQGPTAPPGEIADEAWRHLLKDEPLPDW